MKKIILASASPRRAELLRQIGLDFSIKVSGVAEEETETDPLKLAEKLAVAKAQAVAFQLDNGIIIAADTVVAVDGQLLGKPESYEDAVDMLKILSGKNHQVLTGVAIIELPEQKIITHVETTKVFMRPLLEEEIHWYVSTGEPFDKAGGYGIQGSAAVFVEKLEGCYFNVVGLPLSALWRMLGQFGIKVWEGAEFYDITAPNHQGFTSK